MPTTSGMPPPEEHRGSIMSFSDLAMERAVSTRGATGENDDRYILQEFYLLIL